MAAGFRSGDVVSVGTAAAWSVGADGPHPARTAVTLDTRATMASRTTSFSFHPTCMSLNHTWCNGRQVAIGRGNSETPREGEFRVYEPDAPSPQDLETGYAGNLQVAVREIGAGPKTRHIRPGHHRHMPHGPGRSCSESPQVSRFARNPFQIPAYTLACFSYIIVVPSCIRASKLP